MDLGHLLQNQSETAGDGETVTVQNGSLPAWLRGTIYTTGPGKFEFKSDSSSRRNSNGHGNGHGQSLNRQEKSPDSSNNKFTVNNYNDGYAILCKFEIRGSSNTVNFKKVYERSDARGKADAAGKPVLAEYFTNSSSDVTKNRFSRWISILPELSDNGNHNIYKFGDKLFTSCGLSFFREINPNDLTVGPKFDTNKLFGLTGLAPHPIIDEEGNFYNTGGAVSATGAKQAIIKVPAPGSGSGAGKKQSGNSTFAQCAKNYETLAVWPMSRLMHCTIHHSFTMTQNYIVLIEQPFAFNLKKLFNWVCTGNPTSLFSMTEWEPDLNSQFGGNFFVVVDKRSGSIVVKREVTSEKPFFFLHFVNSYEDEDQDGRPLLIVDLITHPNPESSTSKMSLKVLKSGPYNCCSADSQSAEEGDQGIIERYVLPLPYQLQIQNKNKNGNAPPQPQHKGQENENGKHLNSNFGAKFNIFKDEKFEDKNRIIVSPGEISCRGIKSVAINPKFRFKKNRFVYGNSGWSYRGRYGGRIVKFDLDSAQETCITFGDEFLMGEMVFAPRPIRTEKIGSSNQVPSEDDGILICAVYEDGKRREGRKSDSTSNFLSFICAKSMKEVGRAFFENSIPVLCHAIYAPQ